MHEGSLDVVEAEASELEGSLARSDFKCPRECKYCCMTGNGMQFQCRVKSLYRRNVKVLQELGKYSCDNDPSYFSEKSAKLLYVMCNLTTSGAPQDMEAEIASLDKQIAEVAAQLKEANGKVANVEKTAAPVNAEIATYENTIAELEATKANSEKAMADLEAEIKELEGSLMRGEKPTGSLLQQAADADEDVDEDENGFPSFHIPHFHHWTKEDCTPVSDMWPVILEGKQKELAEKKAVVGDSQQRVKAAQQQVDDAGARLEAAKASLKTAQDDPAFKEVMKKIQPYQQKRNILLSLKKKGFSTLRYHLLRLNIAASRNTDIAYLVYRLTRSESGESGPERKESFDKFVASEAGTTLHEDKARLEKFCATRKIKCTPEHISEYFDALRHETSQIMTIFAEELQKAVDGDATFSETKALGKQAFILEKLAEVGDLVTAWQFEDPVRFNEVLWMKYLNWVEDSESAVRVYIKVTNREREANQPSNSLLTCAEQRADLPYIPDRMVRITDCKEPSSSSRKDEEKACASHTEWDDKHPKQVYGPFFGVYASSDASGKNGFENNIANADVYGYQKDVDEAFDWAPHMRSVLRQAQSGYSIVIFGYGYSGTGKTYTLLGKGQTPGVMTLGLQEMQENIKSIKIRFKELYGQMSLDDGRPEIGETGLYSYKIAQDEATGMPMRGASCPGNDAADCVDYEFWGRDDNKASKASSWKPSDMDVPSDFIGFLEKEDHTTSVDTVKIAENGRTIGEWIQSALELIQTTREHMRCRKEGRSETACKHVRSTPNNPESSRGHLFTMLDVLFKAHPDDPDQSDKTGKIVIVDCAGSEQPASIMKDYVDFGADGASTAEASNIDVADMRASRYLKMYDATFGRKPKLWNTRTWDQVVAGKKMEEWQSKAAEQWLAKQPEDYRAPFGATADDRDKRKFKTEDDRNTKLRLDWSKIYLMGKGIVATVKEGVFINESLNHLKQFLLRRAGKIKSLVQFLQPGSLGMISDPNTVVPGVTVSAPGQEAKSKPLPMLNDWDFDAAEIQPFVGTFNEVRPNEKYDPVPSYYHPKQFIKPWSTRKIKSDQGRAFRKEANNTDSLISSARCVFDWPTKGQDKADPDFDCNNVVVDGVKLGDKGKANLQKGNIPQFDPLIMTSMLNYLDNPEHFGKPANEKPTKFLMMAAVRREHPLVESTSPDHSDPEAFKRHKYNICKGAEMTLNFADEMNPLSKRFSA